MTAYRFCRPDDIPLLVRAVRECFEVHDPPPEPMTVEGFRREMKELDLWPSNSLVAILDDEPVAVLTATKREHEVLVRRVGVRPEHRRRGHGRHLLTSLSQKLAVLGPPRLVAEVPERPGLEEFFAAAGYRRETALSDWVRPLGEPPGAVPEGLVIPASLADLEANDALEVPAGVAWERQRQTLVQRGGRLAGRAVASVERIEAWLLADEAAPGGGVEVWGAGCAEPERREVLLGLLLRDLIQRHPGAEVRLPRLAAGEVPEALLAGLGFTPRARYHRRAAVARPL